MPLHSFRRAVRGVNPRAMVYFEDADGNPVLDNIEDDEEYDIVADAFDELMDSEEYDELFGDEDDE